MIGVKHKIKRFHHWSVLVSWSGWSKNNRGYFKLILCCFWPISTPMLNFIRAGPGYCWPFLSPERLLMFCVSIWNQFDFIVFIISYLLPIPLTLSHASYNSFNRHLFFAIQSLASESAHSKFPALVINVIARRPWWWSIFHTLTPLSSATIIMIT